MRHKIPAPKTSTEKNNDTQSISAWEPRKKVTKQEILKAKILIRHVLPEEVNIAYQWAVCEGWNPGQHDMKCYYEANQKSFLILLLDNNPVGIISVMKYSDDLAFIGTFIVRPEYRGLGLGLRLWQEALKDLNNFKSVGLYSVPPQIPRYEKSKFTSYGKNIRRYNFFGGGVQQQKKEYFQTLKISGSSSLDVLNNMFKYDESNFFADRIKFFNTLLNMPNVHAVLHFNTKNRVDGYGVLRPLNMGYRLGPLYAEQLEVAKIITKRLFQCLISKCKVILDMPEQNQQSSAFSAHFDLKLFKPSNTLTMWRGDESEEKRDCCYALNSLEIG